MPIQLLTKNVWNIVMHVLLIQNCSTEGFGLYETFLKQRDFNVEILHPYRGDPFHNAKDIDAVIIGGTPVSASRLANHPYLLNELVFLKVVIAKNIPCLGICFGAQLLSLALGGEVTQNPQKEIGIYEVELTQTGKIDPVLKGFPARFPVFQWHSDTFSVPLHGELLAKGQACRNQMFRLGKSVGIQFHLEIDSPEADRWCSEYAEELKSFGKSREDISAEFKPVEKQMAELAEKLISNFMSQIMEDTYDTRNRS
jgi:GMP synthase (glutamine-hydrolysing)